MTTAVDTISEANIDVKKVLREYNESKTRKLSGKTVFFV
jgi:hypothetical protein